MANIQLSGIQSLLYEMRRPMQNLYPTRNFLLAAWSGAGQDGAPGRITPLEDREAFNGSKVRIPVDVQMMEAGGWVAEGGTVNVPIPPAFTQAEINLHKFVQPFGVSLEAMEDSEGDNAVVSAVARALTKARQAMADRVNVAMCSGGAAPATADGGLLGTVTDATGSPGLVVPMPVGTDWDKFYDGQIVDFLTKTTGANPGNGLRRKITAISITAATGAGTITIDTAQQASDGSSGNLTFAATTGVYVPGSWGPVALQGGLESAKHATTFENIVRANFPAFNAVDGRAGDTTTLPFSDGMVDLGVTLAQRANDTEWDFAVGDPNSINVYKNGKANQVHYSVATGKVAGRFTGITIDCGNQQITVVPERKLKPGTVDFLRRDAATLYGRKRGPDFDEITGSMFKQLQRTTDYEVWLLDRIEWGWHNPASITYFENLSTQNTAG